MRKEKTVPTLREKIDFLLKSNREVESAILAQAIEVGIAKLYSKAIANAYLEGTIDRQTAISDLGEEKVNALDYAIQSVEKDVAWGLRDAV